MASRHGASCIPGAGYDQSGNLGFEAFGVTERLMVLGDGFTSHTEMFRVSPVANSEALVLITRFRPSGLSAELVDVLEFCGISEARLIEEYC